MNTFRLKAMPMPANKVLFQVDIETGEVWLDAAWTNNWPSGKAVMEPSSTLRFCITFPLTQHKLVELTHDDGQSWTQQQFIEAVRAAYKTVYQEEEVALRAGLQGPYGIVDNDLADLILEGAMKENEIWTVLVGN